MSTCWLVKKVRVKKNMSFPDSGIHQAVNVNQKFKMFVNILNRHLSDWS